MIPLLFSDASVFAGQQRCDCPLTVVFDEPQILPMFVRLKDLRVLKSVGGPCGHLEDQEAPYNLLTRVHPLRPRGRPERLPRVRNEQISRSRIVQWCLLASKSERHCRPQNMIVVDCTPTAVAIARRRR